MLLIQLFLDHAVFTCIIGATHMQGSIRNAVAFIAKPLFRLCSIGILATRENKDLQVIPVLKVAPDKQLDRAVYFVLAKIPVVWIHLVSVKERQSTIEVNNDTLW